MRWREERGDKDVMEGRERQDGERNTEGRGIKREEEKRKWNIKISGHVFVISGPISCLAMSPLRGSVGMHAASREIHKLPIPFSFSSHPKGVHCSSVCLALSKARITL